MGSNGHEEGIEGVRPGVSCGFGRVGVWVQV